MLAFRKVAAAAAGLGMFVTGCSDVVGPEEADPWLQTVVVPGDDWIRVERPGFSFLLPDGFEKLPLQPIDSDAAVYQRGDSWLSHDYGFYTGPWSNGGQVNGTAITDVVRERVRIGGKEAEMVAFRYGRVHVVRAWWGAVGEALGMDEHLMMRIETEDVAVRAQLLASIYSVRFR